MKSNIKAIWLMGTLTLLMASAGHAGLFHHKHKDPSPVESGDTATAPPDQMQTVDPQTGEAPQTSEQMAQYDEVGYAVVGNTGGVSLSTAHLPVPSFVELTNLNNGKTILAVVQGASVPSRSIAALSPQAIDLLGAQRGGNIPLRVRRVSPSVAEQQALLNGQKAADRIDTPPVLLQPLMRKLHGVQGEPADVADDGATAPTKAAVKPRPKASTRPLAVAPQPESTANGRFIVEQAGQPDRALETTAPVRQPAKAIKPVPTTRPTLKPTVAPTAEASGSFFIQVIAVSSEAKAKAIAAKLHAASVEPAGQIWRVRMGPYASEAKAQAQLGPLAAKGYRDVRITH